MGKYHNILKITLPLLEFNHNVYKPSSSVAEEQLQRTFLLLCIVLLTISQCELDLLLSGLESRRAEDRDEKLGAQVKAIKKEVLNIRKDLQSIATYIRTGGRSPLAA